MVAPLQIMEKGPYLLIVQPLHPLRVRTVRPRYRCNRLHSGVVRGVRGMSPIDESERAVRIRRGS